jgi:alpha-tubulin suppressor-like RCC1 family protein
MRPTPFLISCSLSSLLLACVGDSPATQEGGTDAGSDVLVADSPSDGTPDATDGGGDAGPMCSHTCANGYTCQNGHCGNDARELSMGVDVSCVVLYAGEVWCWGTNAYGQIGVPPSGGMKAPQKIAGVSNAMHVAAFYNSVCASDSNGAVYCWGANDFGQLGHNTGQQGDNANCSGRACNYTPTLVGGFPGGTKVLQLTMSNTYIDAGGLNQGQFVCGRTDTGKVYCWGSNGHGVCGQALNQATISSATAVPSLTNVTDISAGFVGHECAVANGSAYCWGWNNVGQLGHAVGTNGDQSGAPCFSLGSCNNTPVQVSGVTGAVAVGTGADHSCAAITNGGVSCWGINAAGALGNGQTASNTYVALVSVVSPLPQKIVALGGRYITKMAIDDTGAAWSWGDNAYGELGVGNITGPSCPSGQPCNSTPQKITSVTNFVQISEAVYTFGGVTADGKVYMWGAGSHGSGDMTCFGGSSTCNPTPQPFPGLPQ